MQFRNNINALRAIAVLSVVLYHFNIFGFSGGFIGVDVFFVISGFLMTGIILKSIQEERLSLLEFYASRARRIIPALAVLCVAILLFGFIYLPLDDYRDIIRSIKSSMIFSSNFSLAEAGDYFEVPLNENWLLHTWSLSVEWQFYLIYPLLLIFLSNLIGIKNTKKTLILIAAVSLASSIYITNVNPTFAFYMLPTRVWELIAGGLVFMYPLKISRRTGLLFECLGLTAIVISVIKFSSHDLWPGYLALLPVFGTILVIYGNTLSVFSRNWALQFVGKISYSVYLWHWPLVVLLYTSGLLESRFHVFISILLSFMLGTLSFYFIESKVKKSSTASKTIFIYLSIIIVIILASASIASLVKKAPQLLFSFNKLDQPEYSSQLYTQTCYSNEYGAADCKLGEGEISAIIFGDSHAQSSAAAVQIENKTASLSWALGGCPTLQNFQFINKDLETNCRKFNSEKMAILNESYKGLPVILLSKLGMYLNQNKDNDFRIYFDEKNHNADRRFVELYTAEYVRTVCSISENHPVIIVRPIPVMPFSIYKGLSLQRRVFKIDSDITVPLKTYKERHIIANEAIDTAAKECNVQAVDPTQYLCPEGRCMGSKNGVPLYFDDNHLVDAGNILLRPLFKDAIQY